MQRDCAFALANIADSVEFQNDVVREGGIEVLVKSGLSDDARVQRDTARAFSALTLPEHLKKHIVDKDALPTLFALARSLDVASQRYSTLAICNLSAGDLKSQVRGAVCVFVLGGVACCCSCCCSCCVCLGCMVLLYV